MQHITPTFSVEGQLTPEAIEAAVADGFTTIVNNRPDDEEEGQPTAAACARRAAALGATYHHIPTPGSRLDPAAVDAFSRAINGAEGPVLAHCRTGTRSLMLWLIGQIQSGAMDPEEATSLAHEHGFDTAALDEWRERAAAAPSARPVVDGFFDARTFSVQYVVSDPATGRCAIIDPVLDYDEKSGATATHSADAILAHIRERGLQVDWILDTHPHADHFSAATYLREQTGAPTAIGERVVDVQALWKDLYGFGDEVPGDGSQWDRLFADGDRFRIGDLEASVMFSPGHTLASITYVIGDAAFVHDTIFMPDFGTARADFPGGSAAQLWRSMQAILALPDDTRVFVGHDYMPNGRAPRWESSVREQKACNPHLAETMDEAAFVRLRDGRDRTLPMPKLILHALQVNIRGGRLPEPDAGGRRILRIPLDALEGAAWDPQTPGA